MSFRTKLTVLFVGIVLFVAAGISSFVYTSNIKTLQAQIKDKLEYQAYHTMQQIDMMLFERYADIRALASDAIITSRSSSQQQVTARLIEYRNIYKSYISLSFFDLDRVRIADTAGLELGARLDMTPYFREVLQDGISAASDIHIADSLKKPVVYFASTVRDAGGDIFGVVVGRMPLRRLYDTLGELTEVHGGQDMSIDLIDRNGLLLYSNHNRKGILRDNLSEWEGATRARSGEVRGSSIHLHEGREETLYVFVRQQGYLDFPGHGWTLIINIPTQTAFAPAIAQRNYMLGIFFAVLLISVVAITFFARSVARPVKALHDAVLEVGTGQLDARVEVSTRDEIGELAAAFNAMIINLKKTTASRDALNKEVIERKRAEEQMEKYMIALEQSNRDLEELATIASHDLQEPLRAIVGYLQLIEKDRKDQMDERDKEFLDRCVTSAKRLQDMISALLAYARITTQGNPFTVCAAEDILKSALENLSVSIEKAKAVITHDPLPAVSGDRFQLTRLFQNVIGNALKFRGDHPPEIHVSARRIGSAEADAAMSTDCSGYVFSVRDNGIGIEPKFHEKIFGVFQRLHSRDHYPGTGLGLAACKKIIERHGGSIWLESEPGAGTTFYFTIPEAQDSGT